MPPAGSDALVAVDGVGITHAGADAPTPADVSFAVAPGEVVLLLGPSGSGKSTLALALNGLVPHAVPARMTGRVRLAGIGDTAEATVARASTAVAMVFQDPDAQIVTGSVLDEVAFGLENLRLPVADVLARSEEALTRLGLWDRRHENPDRLSGGGRQRLAIAAALAMGSPVLVLDEPTANLDPQGVAEVYAALADVVAAGDRAIVLVEHDLDGIVGLVDRVVAIDGDGCLVADGPVDEVLRGQAERLAGLGVWLPLSTIAALRLRDAGYALGPLPLTPEELREALVEAPEPAGVGAAPARAGAAAMATATAADPVVTVRGLRIERGGRRILDGIDLDIGAGEFVAIVGANGAGKTTLVQAIAGVVPATRRRGAHGHIRTGGLDPARADPAALARTVGFVFQNPEHQFVETTVFDELAHGVRLAAGADEDAVRLRVDDVLERFGLGGRATAHPFLLSGGQKRRLSVGTALVANAPILALDEPTFGQDRARADELLKILGDLHRAGTTILAVTHDMQLVAEHATRVIVLEEGRIAADGPPAEVFADEALLVRAGLAVPVLTRALRDLPGHPRLDGATRLADLPREREVS